jgi:F-type H+-transporting ATPase subunit alpha
MEEQVVAIFAAINGYLDGIEVADVPRFQDELREHLRSEETIYTEIREKKDLPDDLADKLRAELDRFKDVFGGSASEG